MPSLSIQTLLQILILLSLTFLPHTRASHNCDCINMRDDIKVQKNSQTQQCCVFGPMTLSTGVQYYSTSRGSPLREGMSFQDEQWYGAYSQQAGTTARFQGGQEFNQCKAEGYIELDQERFEACCKHEGASGAYCFYIQ